MSTRLEIQGWPAKNWVDLLAGVTYQKITSEGVTLSTQKAEHITVPADTVMVVSVAEADHTLCQELNTLVPEPYEIGDRLEPGMIVDAVVAGKKAALARHQKSNLHTENPCDGIRQHGMDGSLPGQV